MTVHTNTAILKAYADNTDLVVFIRDLNSKWIRTNPKALMDYPDDEFFACLPQHEKPCLHWLNGDDVEFQLGPDWFAYSPEYNETYVWSLAILFMDKTHCLREKPRKEKRFVFAYPDGSCSMHYSSKDELYREYSSEKAQLFEIEVEV